MHLNKNLIFIIVCAVIFMGLYVFFYPSMYTIMDEATYFDFAYNLKDGKIKYQDPMQVHFAFNMSKGYVSNYPAGLPLLLLPLTFISWKALFLLNPILHIAAFVLFCKLLEKYSLKSYLSVFYLFYPGFIIYSRTLISDMASASFLMMALYFYFKDNKKNLFIAGLLLGYLCLIKYTNMIIVSVIVLAFLYDSLKSKFSKGLSLIYGLLPFFIFIAWYNINYYGSVLANPYLSIGIKFAAANIAKNIPVYIISLIIIYPLMIASPFMLDNKHFKKWVMIVAAAAFLIFVSLTPFHQGINVVHKFTINDTFKYLIMLQRLILPLIPFFLLAYVVMLNKLLSRKILKAAVFISVIVIFFGDLYIMATHQKYLSDSNDIRKMIYEKTTEGSLIICDAETNKFLQKIWGNRKYLNMYSGDIKNYINPKETYLVVFCRKDKPDEDKKIQIRKQQVLQDYPFKIIYNKEGSLSLEIYKII